MNPHKSLLLNIKLITLPYLVTLPNEYKVKVICTGSLPLFFDALLPDVLFVPAFQYNLIFLSQLLTHLKCDALFTSSSCALQCPSLKKPLKIGKIQKGLWILYPDYLASSTSTVPLVNTITASNLTNTNKCSSILSDSVQSSYCEANFSAHSPNSVLSVDHAWHLRLGHMPFAKMKNASFLHDHLPKKQTFLCSTCPMARQQRLFFPESLIHSTAPF